MSLSVCSECQTVEGGWREPTPKEAQDYGVEADCNDVEALVCCACNSIGSHRGIPEHDDLEDR